MSTTKDNRLTSVTDAEGYTHSYTYISGDTCPWRAGWSSEQPKSGSFN